MRIGIDLSSSLPRLWLSPSIPHLISMSFLVRRSALPTLRAFSTSASLASSSSVPAASEAPKAVAERPEGSVVQAGVVSGAPGPSTAFSPAHCTLLHPLYLLLNLETTSQNAASGLVSARGLRRGVMCKLSYRSKPTDKLHLAVPQMRSSTAPFASTALHHHRPRVQRRRATTGASTGTSSPAPTGGRTL